MMKLDIVNFPSKYLTCYESVLMTLLAQQGITNEPPLMGTQASFVFDSDKLTLTPKLRSVDQEWHEQFGIEITTIPAATTAELQAQINRQLSANTPVCLPVDLYTLPHTLHHQKLHQHHYVTIFGSDDNCYYMICPYYRFAGWVQAAMIYDGFFSPVVAAKGAFVITIKQTEQPILTEDQVVALVEKNCRTMLGLEKSAEIPPQNLGLRGLQTFTNHFQALTAKPNALTTHKTTLVNLSRHLKTVGHARRWLHQLIGQSYSSLLTNRPAAELDAQFTAATNAWHASSVQLAMGVHGQKHASIERVIASLNDIFVLETRLYNNLLATLPTYEEGTL